MRSMILMDRIFRNHMPVSIPSGTESYVVDTLSGVAYRDTYDVMKDVRLN